MSQLDLIRFKEDYGQTAFVCQVAGCDRSLIGFPSESQLRDHAHRHSKSLKCYEKDCAYNDIGFTTERSLKNHKRKLHPIGEQKVIPKRINSGAVPPTANVPVSAPQAALAPVAAPPIEQMNFTGMAPNSATVCLAQIWKSTPANQQ